MRKPNVSREHEVNERPDGVVATPLRMEDVYRLIGALYLELDLLRRHVQILKAALDAQTSTESLSQR
jgi:hypothetical protein